MKKAIKKFLAGTVVGACLMISTPAQSQGLVATYAPQELVALAKEYSALMAELEQIRKMLDVQGQIKTAIGEFVPQEFMGIFRAGRNLACGGLQLPDFNFGLNFDVANLLNLPDDACSAFGWGGQGFNPWTYIGGSTTNARIHTADMFFLSTSFPSLPGKFDPKEALLGEYANSGGRNDYDVVGEFADEYDRREGENGDGTAVADGGDGSSGSPGGSPGSTSGGGNGGGTAVAQTDQVREPRALGTFSQEQQEKALKDRALYTAMQYMDGHSAALTGTSFAGTAAATAAQFAQLTPGSGGADDMSGALQALIEIELQNVQIAANLVEKTSRLLAIQSVKELNNLPLVLGGPETWGGPTEQQQAAGWYIPGKPQTFLAKETPKKKKAPSVKDSKAIKVTMTETIE